MLKPERAKYFLLTLIQGCKHAGAQATLLWFRFRLSWKLGIRGPAQWRARPRQLRHDVAVRLQGSSDIDIFSQIFLEEEYLPLRRLQGVSSVLDLGANVGFASAYFLSCFPQSRALAVEPDGQNVEMCRANLRPYGERALVLHGAAWSQITRLSLAQGTNGDGRAWATQVSLPSGTDLGEVEAWDVGSLIDRLGSASIDLLKIDIERAELVVFGETSKTWLHRVHNLCVELHGDDCRAMLFNALAPFDYELELSGELTICRNIQLRIPCPPQP